MPTVVGTETGLWESFSHQLSLVSGGNVLGLSQPQRFQGGLWV